MLTSRQHDDGFTMIELLVAMVLLCLFLAMAGQMLMGWWGSSHQAADSAVAQTNAADALNALSKDIHSAQAPARDGAELTPDDLQDALLRGNAQTPDLMDVLVATPEELDLRVDALVQDSGPPQVECVRYYRDPTTHDFHRAIYASWQSCSANLVEDDVLLKAPPSGVADTPIFSYDLQYNPVNSSPLDPSNCTTQTVTTATGLQLNYIATVHVDLDSFVAEGSTYAGNVRARDQFGIETRFSHDYRYAMGCAF
jgi:prepilin-type N-terminal cleavage/methylation domain-containing protein